MSNQNSNSQIKLVRQAERPTRWYPLPSPSAISYSGLVLSLLKLNRRDHVLDACCGTGHLTFVLAPRVAKSVGVDISRPTLELISSKLSAKELAKRRLEYRCMDICDPAFGEQHYGEFTKVFSIHGLEHVSDPATFVCSLAQCTRQNGSVMVVFPNSRAHGRNFFDRTTALRELFLRCGLSPGIYVMSPTFTQKAIAKSYYSLRNCYRMVRKEPQVSSADEFHQTRYYTTLETTRFSRRTLSIAIGALLPLASRATLFRLTPAGNGIGEMELCILATKLQATQDS